MILDELIRECDRLYWFARKHNAGPEMTGALFRLRLQARGGRYNSKSQTPQARAAELIRELNRINQFSGQCHAESEIAGELCGLKGRVRSGIYTKKCHTPQAQAQQIRAQEKRARNQQQAAKHRRQQRARVRKELRAIEDRQKGHAGPGLRRAANAAGARFARVSREGVRAIDLESTPFGRLQQREAKDHP